MTRKNLPLTVVSLVNLLLLTIHITQDVMHGVEPPRAVINAGVILFVWLAVTMFLMDTTIGYILLFLGSLAAAGMAVIHTRTATTAKWEFVFYWILITLVVTGLYGAVLSVLGVWRLWQRKSSQGHVLPVANLPE